MTQPSISASYMLKNKNINFKNRIVKSAMSEGMASENYLPTDNIIRLYKTWADGGVGLLITGNVMIDRKALGEPRNIVLEDSEDIDLFKKWAEAGTSNNTHFFMQINHPGKQVLKGVVKEAVAPSAIPFKSDLQRFFPKCRALSCEEIEEIIQRFASTAELAKVAGFTGVQIHAAHGYLISQFLSPRHNQRKDKWGGTIENRFRFLSEIYQAIRARVGDDFPIGVKINSSDFMKAGFTEEDSQFVISELEKLGIDLIEISGGTYEKAALFGKDAKPSTVKREAYFLEYTEKLKEITNVPLILTGGFRTSSAMNEALTSGATDFIGLARPMALYPDYPNKLLENKVSNLSIKPVKTGLPFIDNKGLIELTWYNQQLVRIGKGKSTKPTFSPILALLLTIFKNGKEIFEKRRV
ncbi:NADH:flavin oxidoreductase/NADH oxidase family protein [Saliterribacillus persicus]|uniref:2,4-dienoyl-CoA reductase-like NADH-dependent reductase (Old Yellow Enzyme family) n=1 Tax=Saliterribacillus persicus TaxID=930114 RepID=A0A368X7Y3_9BACI|nr:NADH:flavin oxidoreductase/NADH oxidase family protein [Saliterribacillus persicus]RCW63925.1 2,4-dienoyl-CoA reductase-like NADH-dependent reductase (Old Yellow Enzyme family) [Saliterribacillus persicus]